MGFGGRRYTPASLPPGKTRYPLYKRLGGPQGRSGWMRKISSPSGFYPRSVQSVASRYNVWAIPVLLFCLLLAKIVVSSKIVVLFYLLFVLYCSMYCLCVNVYCHRVTTQLQLTNISYHIKFGGISLCLKFPTLRLLALLRRVILRLTRVWTIDGMAPPVMKRNARSRTCPGVELSNTKLTWTGSRSNPDLSDDRAWHGRSLLWKATFCPVLSSCPKKK